MTIKTSGNWGVSAVLWFGLILGGVSAAGAEERAGAEEYWYVVQLGKQRVGYSRTTIVPTSSGLRTSIDNHLRMRRFGQTVSIHQVQTFEQSADGSIQSFRLEDRSNPNKRSETVGTIRDDRDVGGTLQMVVESLVAGRRRQSLQRWKVDIKPLTHRDRLIREPIIRPGEVRTFETYLPELGKTSRVRIAADSHRATRGFDGEYRKWLLLRVTYLELPTLPAERLFVDEQGRIMKMETDLLGQTMTTWTVSAAEALKQMPDAELDLAIGTLVSVKPIPHAHQTERMIYRITTAGEDPVALISAGDTQSVKRIGPNSAEVTVTAVDFPISQRQAKASAEYLASSRFLQKNDARVLDHVRRASAGKSRPTRIAAAMEQYVHTELTEKNFSTTLATAAEVAESREGDCTEHAVLLAAMLRAKNIPSRVAVGLVYIPERSAFGGHMWTEAWLDGKWIPLDGTLGQGGIGAAHIKLADSSLADDAPAPVASFLPMLKLLGNVKIDVVAAEY